MVPKKGSKEKQAQNVTLNKKFDPAVHNNETHKSFKIAHSKHSNCERKAQFSALVDSLGMQLISIMNFIFTTTSLL